MTSQKADTFAFVDEAGEKGLSRNMQAGRDDRIGLLCAIPVPLEHLEFARDLFRPGYDRFISAKPQNAKAHIADAFLPGREDWAAIAKEVRDEYFQIMRECQFWLTYEARRVRIDRQSFESRTKLQQETKERSRTRIRVSNEYDKGRLEHQLMIGLSLKLDSFALDFHRAMIDICFDETDIGEIYQAAIQQTRDIGKPKKISSSGYDPDSKTVVQKEAELHLSVANYGGPLSVEHVGAVHVTGKNDPLIFAVDCVANSLWRHLGTLGHLAEVNAPGSIAGWELEERVYGALEGGPQEFV